VQKLTWILEFNVQLNPLVSNNAKRVNEIHDEQTIHTIEGKTRLGKTMHMELCNSIGQ